MGGNASRIHAERLNEAMGITQRQVAYKDAEDARAKKTNVEKIPAEIVPSEDCSAERDGAGAAGSGDREAKGTNVQLQKEGTELSHEEWWAKAAEENDLVREQGRATGKGDGNYARDTGSWQDDFIR